ncbi:NYN domain-containing protein [Acaryochloris sp. IP29b_bin.137]|uniref:NYN domain-containing protein n=1 Tax=Acaryochloris sp. IP29b_bin.137 TaxID=2969217 RepID=UPI00262F3092|nr:NYN domain-containing protein [Acaryochloris sp. IP29b_bin.137]
MAASSEQPILLIDGYNILGVWSQHRNGSAPAEIFENIQELETTKLHLTDALANYSAFQGYQARLVFDAQNRQEKGICEPFTDALDIYYTDYGQTADTYIELYCAKARSRLVRIIVATSDRAQQLTVMGYGAEWMSALQLVKEMAATTTKIRSKQNAKKRAPSRLLSHSLSPETQQKLERWRMG